jgi:hypothetical protein
MRWRLKKARHRIAHKWIVAPLQPELNADRCGVTLPVMVTRYFCDKCTLGKDVITVDKYRTIVTYEMDRGMVQVEQKINN